MLDDMLKQIKEAENEAKKIAARGHTEAERILRKIDKLREKETARTIEEVNALMAQLEKIKLQDAEAKAREIKRKG